MQDLLFVMKTLKLPGADVRRHQLRKTDYVDEGRVLRVDLRLAGIMRFREDPDVLVLLNPDDWRRLEGMGYNETTLLQAVEAQFQHLTNGGQLKTPAEVERFWQDIGRPPDALP